MPPYHQTFITIEEFSPQRRVSLSSIYNAFLINDFKFGGKYPFYDRDDDRGEHNSGETDCDEWEHIIAWNQERIDQNFSLGWTQSPREGYQQFLLHHPLYRECRVLTSSSFIIIIIPEYEVTLPEFEWCEGISSLNTQQIQPLKELSLSVWSTNSVTSIQTAPENGGYTSYEKLLEGDLPFMLPFAIIDKKCNRELKRLHPKRKIRGKELDSGSLLTSSEAIYGH